MAQPSATSSFTLPSITPTDLEAFHKSHFSPSSIEHFSTNFLGPVPEDGYEEEEEEYDDGLGYYPDGVKRTLTDEQIAMFRHSEIQALLRERRHAEENRETPTDTKAQVGEVEEGELEEDQDVSPPEDKQPLQAAKSSVPNTEVGEAKRRKGDQRKGKGYKHPPKPDLRKRTWDKVDSGLQSLDYGEEEGSGTNMPAAPQRRRISYDDV